MSVDALVAEPDYREVNEIVARLAFMVNGALGRDWRSGEEFVLHTKGNEVKAIRDALRVIWHQRHALESERSEITKLIHDIERHVQIASAEASRADRLEKALRNCQRVIAMLLDPKSMSGVSVKSAWAQCVEAETVARAALGSAKERET